MKLHQINEKDLETLEQLVPEIMDFCAFSASYSERQDIRDSLTTIKTILSDVRWNYGPFDKAKIV